MKKLLRKVFRHSSEKVYVLPTGYGVLYGFGLFSMFIAAASYSNNLVYLLTFIVLAIMLASLINTNYNLRGLKITNVAIKESHVDDDIVFKIFIQNDTDETKYGIEVRVISDGVARSVGSLLDTLEPHAQRHVEVRTPGVQRGLHRLEVVRVATVFPIGLWRSWAYFHGTYQYCVYPRCYGTQPLPEPSILVEGEDGIGEGMDDFAEHRLFVQGDSFRHVDWKARARGLPLLVKRFTAGVRGLRLLDWDQVQDSDPERRLEQIAKWVDQCHRLNEPYGLMIPGASLPPTFGLKQFKSCMRELAKYGSEHRKTS